MKPLKSGPSLRCSPRLSWLDGCDSLASLKALSSLGAKLAWNRLVTTSGPAVLCRRKRCAFLGGFYDPKKMFECLACQPSKTRYQMICGFFCFRSCGSTTHSRSNQPTPNPLDQKKSCESPESLVPVGTWSVQSVSMTDLEWMFRYGRSDRFVGFEWISAYLGCSVVLLTKIYQDPVFAKCLFLEVSSPFSLPGSLLG